MKREATAIPENSASGHRERLRRRWLSAGPEAFADHELIELLLCYAIPRKDVKPLARRLISRFGGIKALLEAPLSGLQAEEGVGEAAAVMLKLIRELSLRGDKAALAGPTVRRPEDLRELVSVALSREPEECVGVILLDQRNRSQGLEVVERGIENRAQVYLKRVLRLALDRRATGLILVHNHPAGSAEFSKQDRDFTRRAKTALEAVDIRLLDHLLVAGDKVVSMVETGEM